MSHFHNISLSEHLWLKTLLLVTAVSLWRSCCCIEGNIHAVCCPSESYGRGRVWELDPVHIYHRGKWSAAWRNCKHKTHPQTETLWESAEYCQENYTNSSLFYTVIFNNLLRFQIFTGRWKQHLGLCMTWPDTHTGAHANKRWLVYLALLSRCNYVQTFPCDDRRV